MFGLPDRPILCLVHDLRVGTVLRAVRRRRGWRQLDVAKRGRVSQSTVSAAERGAFESLSLRTLRRVAAALEVELQLEPRWRGGEVARLVDARHAALVDRVVALLAARGWDVTVEYSFSRGIERGSVDVLAWNASRRALLIVEVKSELDDVQDALMTFGRKIRLVPAIVAAERRWLAGPIGAVLVMPETSTSRDRIARHAATFAAALPGRNRDVHRWLRAPAMPLRAVWFFRDSGPRSGMEARGGPRRVRAHADTHGVPG